MVENLFISETDDTDKVYLENICLMIERSIK